MDAKEVKKVKEVKDVKEVRNDPHLPGVFEKVCQDSFSLVLKVPRF